MTDEEIAKRMADKIADSLQNRIDEASEKNRTEVKNSVVAEPSKENTSGTPTGIKIVFAVAGALALAMGYAFYIQLDKAKLKKA